VDLEVSRLWRRIAATYTWEQQARSAGCGHCGDLHRSGGTGQGPGTLRLHEAPAGSYTVEVVAQRPPGTSTIPAGMACLVRLTTLIDEPNNCIGLDDTDQYQG
jgi:hypothetical protein